MQGVILLASGEWGHYAGGRIAAPYQSEEHRMSDAPGFRVGGTTTWITVAQVAPWRPETIAPAHLPLLAYRQPTVAWQASPLNPRRHRPDGIQAGAPSWPSREAALCAAAAWVIAQARRCCRLPGPQRPLHSISRAQCRRIVAWARGVAGLPEQARGYEALDLRRPAADPGGQMLMFEEVVV